MSLYPLDYYRHSILSDFEQCPYAFYMTWIEGKERVENFFAQYGTLMHGVIEKWAKKVIKTEDMRKEWEENYITDITESVPSYLATKGYEEKTYQQALDYIDNFDGFPGYKVIDVEKHFEIDLFGRKLSGTIDMILEDENNGDLVIVDHKSKSLSAYKKAVNKMIRQLYLYSKAVKDIYGKYPTKLIFNLFREQKQMVNEFNDEEYSNTLNWAKETMEKIESFDVIDYLETHPDFFYCNNLCNVRQLCES